MIATVCFGLMGLAALAVQPVDAANRLRAGTDWWTSTEVQESLSLTPDQVQKIADLEAGKHEAMIAARQDLMKAYRRVVTALDGSAAPSAELADRQQTLEKAWVGYLQVDVNYWMELRGVLTQQQWQQLPNVAPRALRMGMLGVRGRGKVNVGGGS